MAGNATSRLERLIKDKHQRETLLQIARFGIAGVGLTVLVLGLAWLAERSIGMGPNSAFALAFVFASLVGFFLHGNWSFKGHGARDRLHVRLIQFFIGNIIGFLLNQFFVWLIRHHWGLPFWVEALPVTFVTPLVTFTLNRKWVFA